VEWLRSRLRQLDSRIQYQTSTSTMTFYITLLSDELYNLYPNNTIARFLVWLPRPVELLQGAWEVGLYEMSYPTLEPATEPQTILVYCDLIGSQVVSDTLARFLRTVHYPSPGGYHVLHACREDGISDCRCRNVDQTRQSSPISKQHETISRGTLFRPACINMRS